MRIAIITSGILPVPAVQGGAVENLVDIYLEYNDKYKLHDITVYSVWHPDVEKHPALKSKANHYIFIKVNGWWNKLKKKIYQKTHGQEYYHYTIEYFLHEAIKDVRGAAELLHKVLGLRPDEIMVFPGPAGVLHRHERNPAHKGKGFADEVRHPPEPPAVLPVDYDAELDGDAVLLQAVEPPHGVPPGAFCPGDEVMVAIEVRVEGDAHDEPPAACLGCTPREVSVLEAPPVAQDMDGGLRERGADFPDELKEHPAAYGWLAARNADLAGVLWRRLNEADIAP